MKYDDLEKTQDLFDIKESVPTPIDNIEEEGINKDKLTDDLTFGLVSPNASDAVKGAKETTDDFEIPEIPKTKKEKKKALKEEKKSSSSPKKKIIVIASIILALIIIGLVIYFLFIKPHHSEDTKKPNKPTVIVEAENYRYQDGTLTFLDVNENELGTYECTNKEEKLCYVASYSDEDNFDISKNVYENNTVIPKRSKIYLDNYVFINDSSSEEEPSLILYNIKDQEKLGTYKLVKGFSDSDYVILKDTNDKYGTISFEDDTYKTKVEFGFSYIGMLNKDSNLVIKNENNYYIYNQAGEVQSKALAYPIKNYDKDHIIVENENNYYVFDYSANQIFNEEYEYITLFDKYAVLIQNQTLYLKDFENNKYLEDGIDLNSKDYTPLNVYDKNKIFIEKKEAFNLSINDNIITVSYKNHNTPKEKTINIYEGLASSKISNLNYFDGKLYIYKDDIKSELIGVYTCSNKNILNSADDSFKNCTIAQESFFSTNEIETDNTENLGLLPIFNDRYAFIEDTLDTSKPTITLYDLKDKKTLSKYSSVDAGNYTTEPNLTFIETEEAYVMASNKSNKYGVIKISKDRVSSAIHFEYNKIEKIKEYFMATGNADNYMLIDSKGEIITDKLGRKIVDYNGEHLKTMDSSGRYYVSDFKGYSFDSTGYLDITLGSDFYAVVTSNYNLDLAKYDDPTFSLSRQIDIGANYQNNYTVEKDNGGYVITIKSTNTKYRVDNYGIIIEDSN